MVDLNQKYKYGSIPQKVLLAGANILYGHLLMCEIMMADLQQKYVMRLSNSLCEEGLGKHKVKQLINQMLGITKDLKKRCDDHDGELVLGFTMDTWPLLVNRYYEEGGTVTQRLQWMFNQRNGNLMTMLYVACKDSADRNKIPHSAVVADAMMVLQLAQSSIDLFDFIERKIHSMLGGHMKIVKSTHNEKMRGLGKEMLRILTNGYEVDDKDGERIRSLVEKFYHELTSEALLQCIDDSISDMRKDYCRFVLATLAGKVERRELSFHELKLIMARIGSFKNTRTFVGELRRLKVDPASDPMDVKDELDLQADTTPLLAEFSRLCHDGETMKADPEDERSVRLRELRQEARRNQGALPEGSLIQLYRELGTKKAVDEWLADAGEELSLSRKHFRKMNVSNYKTKTKNGKNNNVQSGAGKTSTEVPEHHQAIVNAGVGGYAGGTAVGRPDVAPCAPISIRRMEKIFQPGVR
jgi:hypothetical protein